MKHNPLSKFWRDLFTREKKEAAPAAGRTHTLRIDPLTVGLRIDLTVTSGAGKDTTASQFVWVSPTGSTRSVRALRVLLLPN